MVALRTFACGFRNEFKASKSKYRIISRFGAIAMNFDYDELRDSLLFSKKKKNDLVKGSATVGDLVLDFTQEGKVVGLEIRQVTEFFKTMGVDGNPSEIESAFMHVQYRLDGLVIIAELRFLNHEETRLPIFVSSETPILVES